jgi:hypothetical protein
MEEAFYASRVQLQQLLREYPYWTKQQLVEATGRSIGWVKKWKKRILAAPDDPQILCGRSRRPHKTPEPIHLQVVKRILEIRDHPPDHLQRTPGPLAIIYFLHQDEALKARGYHLPTSTSTIWRILDDNHRIVRLRRQPPEPLERPEPMRCWQIDFKDVSTIPPHPEGKRQHAIETWNVVDEGSSMVLDAIVRADFTMETAVWAAVHTLLKHGVPQQVTFDRDTRFVGSWAGQDFPTPFMRLWLTLGVKVNICPPRRPDRNAYVERYHRNYNTECLQRERPTDQETTERVTQHYVEHYNHERPNQALSCKNQPPARAFPVMPILPRLPEAVDPDAWLKAIDGRCYTRRLNRNGCLNLDNQPYYVSQNLNGQFVKVRVNAQQHQLVVEHQGQIVKRLTIKGLANGPTTFETYFEWMLKEAGKHWRKLALRQRPPRKLHGKKGYDVPD